jgi:hypothetical protein
VVFACDFSDSASDYTAARILKVWDAWTASQPTIGVSDVDGGTIIRPTGLRKNVTASAARIVGWRFKTDQTAQVSGDVLLNFGTGVSTAHDFLTVDNQGRLRLECAAVTLGPSAVNTITVGTYYVVEVGVLISNTVGRVEVKVNGVQVAALTSIALGGSVSNTLDTQSGATTTCGWVMLDSRTGLNWRQEVDWFWTAWDTTVWGSGNWLASGAGALTKKNIRGKAGTAGNGVYNSGTGWAVGVGGPTLSDATREAVCDEDTSYAFNGTVAGTAADRFCVKGEAMPTTVLNVKLMSHRSWVAAPAEASGTFNQFLYEASGGTTHDGSSTAGSTVTYGLAQTNHLVHPNAAPLTRALVNSTEMGVKLLTASGSLRSSTENLFVLYTSGTPPVDPPGTYFDSENACPIGSSFQAGLVRGQGVCA